jgi:N-methylhydantoinase B
MMPPGVMAKCTPWISAMSPTTLMRTAYSTVMREQRDCTTALYDPKGNLIAQADHVPSHQGTLSHAAKTIAAQFEMRPGDVFIFNHPYEGGTHHPDIMIFKPIFFEDRQVALAGALGHHIDVGGRSPGSVATDARDVFEEGLIIPAMRLYKEGAFVDEVVAYIKANVRQPAHTLGDIRAQVSAVTVGERRYAELCRKYGAINLEAIVAGLLDHSEVVMRERLAAYPEGTYRTTGYMDNDGITDEPVRIEVAVRLEGGSVHIDFAGSSPQVKGPFNCSKSSVYSAAYCAVRYMSDPRIFQNEGCYRPISLSLPEKSIVSPVMPAPLSGRFHTMERIATTIVAAFNEPRGEEAVGSNHGHLTSFSVSGRRNGNQPFVFFDLLGGGWGGNSRSDGLSATFGFMANCADAPMEAVELEYPLRVERYELLADSGGAGRRRGGLGVRREIRYLSGDGYFTNRSDAQKFAPPGVLGGLAGRPSRHALVRADGTLQQLPSKATNLEIAEGDLIVLETAGGGGYGDPLQRDSDAVLADVLDGYISVGAAEDDYGVVLNGDGKSVDAHATADRRKRAEADGASEDTLGAAKGEAKRGDV